MMKNILKSLFVAVALVFGVNAYADEGNAVVKMTYVDGSNADTAIGEIAEGSQSNTGYNKISGGKVEMANTGWGVNYITYVQVDASAVNGTITGASLTATFDAPARGHNYGVGYNTSVWSSDMTYNTADRTITTLGTTQSVNKNSTSSLTFDISDALVGDEDKIVTLLIYDTAAGGGHVTNPSVSVTYIDANAKTANYTLKFVDAATNDEIKSSLSITGVVGETCTVDDENMVDFFNEDKSKKYIYVGNDASSQIIAEDGSTVVTLTFREADKYNYSVQAVNAEGELMQTLTSGSDFEGETLYVPYNKYILNYADSTLYEAAGSGDKGLEYRKTLTLNEDGASINVTYNKSSINNVIYFSEAEDTWGMTTTTGGNALVRSSNAAGGYPAEDDVELTGLSTGKYKLTVGFANFKSSSEAKFDFALAEDTLFTLSSTGINLTTVTSDEFTVIGSSVPFKALKGGNEMQAIDFFYIQKTGGVPAVAVANIAALKDVQEGMEVKLALTDAVVNLWSGDYTTQSMASYIEDATGAIKFDISLSNMEWMRDSIAMNGYIYAQYGKDYDGIPQLSVSDSTGASKVDTVAAVPASKVMTVADASNETALSRYVKFEKVEFVKKVVDDWGTTECYLVQGSDTIMFFDKFSRFGWNAMPDFKSFDEVQGFISMYDGKFEFYPYGEYKANYTPAVVAENIAAAKAVESGTNVNLTLKDAKITAYVSSKWGGATAYIEDASGAIQIAGDVLSAIGVENDSTILNGNIYVKYVNEWGSIQLSAGDSIAFSKVEAKVGAVSPTTMAVKDIKAETNVARYVEIAFPSFKYDAENYYYYAAQNGDTIMVVDNFGWMSSNFEMDEEYNLILPDSVSSIRGIVMWDDWNGYSIVPTGIDEFVAPQDIVVNVTEGDIAAAVEAAKAEVAKVGNITINLTDGVEYTVSSSIVAGAGGVAINGNNAVITASAALVSLPAEPLVAANDAKAGFYEITSPITIDAVKVKTAKPIVKSNAKYLISAINVNNSIVELTGSTPVFDFSGQSGYPSVLSVKNSTVWSSTSTGKPFFTSQSGHSPKDINNGTEETQTIEFENSTLYNICTGANFNNLRQKGQKFLIFTIKNNIIINCGKDNFLNGMDGGQNSTNPKWTVDGNTFGKLVDGVFTDISASQTNNGEVTNSITTNPDFKDAANGDFTVGAGSDQAKEKIGDPRWLVEYDNTATAIEGVNATIMNNGDIYTINGVKVRNAGDSLKGLAKGLYIINGKKLIVK